MLSVLSYRLIPLSGALPGIFTGKILGHHLRTTLAINRNRARGSAQRSTVLVALALAKASVWD